MTVGNLLGIFFGNMMHMRPVHAAKDFPCLLYTSYLQGRNYVLPQDVTDIAKDVMLHRLRLSAKARVNQLSPGDVLDEICLLYTSRCV